MLDVIWTRIMALLGATTLLALGGCAGPLDLMLNGMAQAQLTPEGVGATAVAYRGYDCNFLARNIETFQEKMNTDPDKRIWKWHIDAMNQVRAEKNCAVAGATPSVAAAGSPGVPAPEHGLIGLRMDALTPTLATALGLESSKGALVIEAVKGLPADKAGIKAMDVVLAIAGQSISSPQELSNVVSRMRVGYRAEVDVWRDRSRKTLMVEVGSSAQISASQATTKPPAPLPAARPVATGPVVYSYCFYTDVAYRRHWTSNVFELVSTPGVDQTTAMGNEFYQYLSARNKLTPNEQAFCALYDTRAQAEGPWNKTRTLYRFNTVQNNEIVWAPAR